MAEYIEREALIAEIQKNIHTYWSEGSGGYYLAEDALNYSVKTAPTADVVPKSEVDKAIDDLKRYVILNENISKKCKAENGEQNVEYWKGKLSAFLQVRGYIDTELKNKYAEQKNG